MKERLILDSRGHTSFQGIRLVDLTGDGRDELVVESDSREDGVGIKRITHLRLDPGTFR